MQCRDCDLNSEYKHPSIAYAAGWIWIELEEGDDVANGWRCPVCAEGWHVLCSKERMNAVLQ